MTALPSRLKYRGDALARCLRGPSAQEPTAHMPTLGLSDAEVRALAFPASLRAE
jgi:hypothetical protein